MKKALTKIYNAIKSSYVLGVWILLTCGTFMPEYGINTWQYWIILIPVSFIGSIMLMNHGVKWGRERKWPYHNNDFTHH